MAKYQEHTEPLTPKIIAGLKPLPPEEKPPERLTVNLGTFRVPKGVKTSVVSVTGVPDTFQLQVTLPGDAIGRHIPHDSVAAEPFSESKLKEIAQRAVPEDGFRPLHLSVCFQPVKVKLKRTELAHPPFDFKYKPGVNRPTNVFAPDDRRIYHDTSFPWCTVGRVDTPIGTCTGCTIGSRLLLTANHSIQWNADGSAGWVRFRPAYYDGSAPFGEAWATRVIYWVRTNPANGLTNRETAFDYVVCVLDTRIGDVVGYPGYRTYRRRWNGSSYWQHMGYPSDLSGMERPAFQGGCIVSSVSGRTRLGRRGYVLGHFNDVVGGHSGGPVWGWWSDEPWPRVVGTQSSEANTPARNRLGDNEFGGGPALSSLISWARSHYS